jgi:hypothetical protein
MFLLYIKFYFFLLGVGLGVGLGADETDDFAGATDLGA